MRLLPTLLIAFAACASVAADFKDVDPNVFAKDDPRAKDLPKMMWADAKKRMQEANLRESKAFAGVTTKEQWERYRDVRIQKLKESLGAWPDPPKELKSVVAKKIKGDGFVIYNLLYESRPGLWVSANFYLPANLDRKVGGGAKTPGIIISHSHHNPKTHGELQDMGMTWARAGVAVLIPDHLGHGERRQHDFVTAKDYDKPFAVSRQDYYFRYNLNLQLAAAGESLMGWMVWDLMRGVDYLFEQPFIDKTRIILLGAVAGGGDVAAVTAALDKRIACVVPFNFGGWNPQPADLGEPDRDMPWFGEGYWESTRGLKNGARDGFAQFVIVGSIAPRPVIYAHEFAWDAKTDPAWPRLQKIFGFYDAKDKLVSIHGKGSVRGPSGPDNTHCNHIGAVHRKGIYPALKEWFGMPVPEEYSKRLPAEELLCWNEVAFVQVQAKHFHKVLSNYGMADRRAWFARRDVPDPWGLRAFIDIDLGQPSPELERAMDQVRWGKILGNIEPPANPKVTEGKAEDVPAGTLARFVMEPEPGIVVPFMLIMPKGAKEKVPVVVMVGQGGKAAFLKQRGPIIEALLKVGMAVCLVDVRGTGETQPGNGSPERTSLRTSISQTNLILGQTVLGSQLRDLRTVIRWLQARKDVNGKKLAVWGDPLVKANGKDAHPAKSPLDAPQLPRYAEPGGALLALFAALFEDGVHNSYSIGGYGLSFLERWKFWESPYLYLPHDTIVPLTIFSPFGLGGPFDRVITISEVTPHNRRTLLGLPWHKGIDKIDPEEMIDVEPADIAKALAKNFRLP